jgi:hypothetical protein
MARSLSMRDSERSAKCRHYQKAGADLPARLSIPRALYSMTAHLSRTVSSAPSTRNVFATPSDSAVRGVFKFGSIVERTPSSSIGVTSREDDAPDVSSFFGFTSVFESAGVVGLGEATAGEPIFISPQSVSDNSCTLTSLDLLFPVFPLCFLSVIPFALLLVLLNHLLPLLDYFFRQTRYSWRGGIT